MLINCKEILKDLAGEDILDEKKEKFTLGHALGNIVVSAKEGGKMKLFLLGTKLYQNSKVEVDEADLALLKSVVKSSEAYGALILGQCEQTLEGIKENKKVK